MEPQSLEPIEISVEAPFEPPAREQAGGDHDEPWQFQLYHLTDRERTYLMLRRERAYTAEWHV